MPKTKSREGKRSHAQLGALLTLGLLCAPAGAADGVFELGTVTVTGAKEATAPEADETRLRQQDIARGNHDSVGQAVAVLPGVALSRTSRNEDMVYVRGFDARQVPLFVDGVPLYVPYDGYVDFARFTTFDLAEIDVAKAGASLLYGPNTLGGAINLVTRKPTRAFEGDALLGVASGAERKAALNLGTRQERWYAQLGLSTLQANSFPLPHGFVDYKKSPTDTGNYRANAARQDRRLSLKLGLTPNASDEYAFGYVRQEGEKGNPLYTGQSTNGLRYWRWPYWDKDSLYFISSTRLGADNMLKTRLYHDTYSNRIDAYQDASYAQPLVNASFPSVYEDSSSGASIELANYALQHHELRMALHLKQDRHAEHNPLSAQPESHDYRDLTTSLALEDSIALGQRWGLRLGLSHDRREAQQVYQWPTGSTSATNGLIELTHTLNDAGDQAYATASHKTRFPTIKDRYSARLGRALPNPNLRPEVANHLELGWRGAPWQGGKAQAALFYSRITDLMQDVNVPAPLGTCGQGSSVCAQAQNVGKARHMGLELSLQQALTHGWSTSLAYTYLARRNLSDPAIKLTDTPRQRLFATLDWAANATWSLHATLQAEQGRTVAFTSGKQSSYQDLAGFAVLGLQAQYQPRQGYALQFGVSNVGDKWYEYAEGYPMPGRVWYVNGRYRF